MEDTCSGRSEHHVDGFDFVDVHSPPPRPPFMKFLDVFTPPVVQSSTAWSWNIRSGGTSQTVPCPFLRFQHMHEYSHSVPQEST